jgi:hypothetical protein
MAEFTSCNQVSDSTIISPLFVTFSFYSKLDLKVDIQIDFTEEVFVYIKTVQLSTIYNVMYYEIRYA